MPDEIAQLGLDRLREREVDEPQFSVQPPIKCPRFNARFFFPSLRES